MRIDYQHSESGLENPSTFPRTACFFDQRDHSLLEIVNEMLAGDISRLHTQRRFFHHLHPRGIKEMAETRGLRIAYAVIHLLESLEHGEVGNRLCALRALRDEVMASDNQALQINTARVLIEIMKELVRARGHYPRQLQLAHDFRMVASGKPRIVRAHLKKYHLVEMPEAWNQLAFDDHVHDANTKGRKSATHLIMDAWIKGIRRLRVIYYNFIRPETAEELMEAAAIMGVLVRIGIEFSAAFYDRHVHLIWVPRGFADTKDFIRFLSKDRVEALMNDGGEVADYQRNHVLAVLEHFNKTHRHEINEAFSTDLPPVGKIGFLSFVGIGQASLLHLAKYIHQRLLREFEARVESLRHRYRRADAATRREIEDLVGRMDRLDLQAVYDQYLKPWQNPALSPPMETAPGEQPALMRLSPDELAERLSQLHSGLRLTLNLTDLEAEDVLELIHDCKGMITRFEIFNLKDFADGKTGPIPVIAELQNCINSGNVIKLKRIILEMIQKMERRGDEKDPARAEKFKGLLKDIESFKDIYKLKQIKPRMGSDSTGHSPRHYGMGLAIMDTLPRRGRKALSAGGGPPRLAVPFHIDTILQLSYDAKADEEKGIFTRLVQRLRKTAGLRLLVGPSRRHWVAEITSTRIKKDGNIITLGGVKKEASNQLSLAPPAPAAERPPRRIRYLQSTLKNLLKVAVGFVPAFLTFYLTHDWWVLVYFGAFIWFAITGFRNIVQSVMAGGGMRRSSLLRWNDFISWERLSDSLLFTGFSVPLLDYLVKTLLLDRGFSITAATQPALLYTIMAVVNGVYLFSHNLFRGLPREAAVANLFRSVLSIPVAFAFNAAIGFLLGAAGVIHISSILQSWAAVISKFASDFVAGFMEGGIDRAKNIERRLSDYRQKLAQFLDVYARLEMLLPEEDVSDLLDRPQDWYAEASRDTRELIAILIINSLDLLYFWMYQPRARTAFKEVLRGMAPAERCVLIKAQAILRLKREISQMFIDGIAGRNFSKPLAFYLSRADEYMQAIEKQNAAFADSLSCE
jgi:hypothetical protein